MEITYIYGSFHGIRALITNRNDLVSTSLFGLIDELILFIKFYLLQKKLTEVVKAIQNWADGLCKARYL